MTNKIQVGDSVKTVCGEIGRVLKIYDIKDKTFCEVQLADENIANINLDYLTLLCKSSDNKKVKTFKEIVDEMLNLYKAKNSDYGDSFGETFEKLGPVSGLVRISDKFNRLTSLVAGKDQRVEDESIEDTLIDLANYSIMFLIELRENKTKDIK